MPALSRRSNDDWFFLKYQVPCGEISGGNHVTPPFGIAIDPVRQTPANSNLS